MESGSELCATQVPDQSFSHIDEHIDTKASHDKSSTAIILVVNGELSVKQMELEFKNITGSDLEIMVCKTDCIQ